MDSTPTMPAPAMPCSYVLLRGTPCPYKALPGCERCAMHIAIPVAVERRATDRK